MGKDQHVVKNDENWSVKGEGNDRATKNHDTQKEAIAHAETIAQNQNSDVIIHKENGEIRARKSFSNNDDTDTAKSSEKDTSSNQSITKDTKTSFFGRIKSLFVSNS